MCVTSFFHLACFKISPMSWHLPRFHLYLLSHCMDVHHFIYLSIGWWIFSCLHFLAIINNVAITFLYKYFLWMYVPYFAWEYLGVELQNHGKSMFNVLRNCQNASQSECPILHFHDTCLLFLWFQTTQWVWTDTNGFHLHFPKNEWWWTYFHMLIVLFDIFFGGIPLQIFCPFLNGFIWGFYWIVITLYIFWISILYYIHDL